LEAVPDLGAREERELMELQLYLGAIEDKELMELQKRIH